MSFSLLALTAILLAPVPKEKAEAAAFDALAGEWVVTRAEAFGRADELHVGDTLTFDGNALTHTTGDKPLKYRVRVSPKDDPPRMDWTPAGEKKATSHRGVYKLDGDTLTVCVVSRFDAADETDRPTEFRTRAGRKAGEAAGEVLLVLVRKKKE